MKKLSIILIGLFFGTAISCKKFDEKTQFDMTFVESVTVESSVGVDLPFDIYTPERETNSEATFAVNDTRKDLIEEITINYLRLELTSPDGSDFSFLESIDIYLAADGLGETLIAWSEDVGEESTEILDLIVTEADLKEFIKKDKFTLRVNTVTDEFLTSDHQIDILSSFHVDAKIFGQ